MLRPHQPFADMQEDISVYRHLTLTHYPKQHSGKIIFASMKTPWSSLDERFHLMCSPRFPYLFRPPLRQVHIRLHECWIGQSSFTWMGWTGLQSSQYEPFACVSSDLNTTKPGKDLPVRNMTVNVSLPVKSNAKAISSSKLASTSKIEYCRIIRNDSENEIHKYFRGKTLVNFEMSWLNLCCGTSRDICIRSHPTASCIIFPRGVRDFWITNNVSDWKGALGKVMTMSAKFRFKFVGNSSEKHLDSWSWQRRGKISRESNGRPVKRQSFAGNLWGMPSRHYLHEKR